MVGFNIQMSIVIKSLVSKLLRSPIQVRRISWLYLTLFLATSSQAQQSVLLDDNGYRLPPPGESEFNHYSDDYVVNWQNAIPAGEYEDSEFGELMYNEPSTPTKLEVLRLLSKDTPSLMVFMTAVSMGLDIENVLQAAVRFQPDRSRGLAASAVNLVPVISDSEGYLYSSYELADLEREDQSKPYEVQQVLDRFFKKRQVLRPYPDWFAGQYHFMASAAELKEIAEKNVEQSRWYQANTSADLSKRPVFVSLYEDSGKVLVDSEMRIKDAIAKDPDATLPVVFIFNRLNERAVDDLGYPKTIKGVQQAYVEKGLMVTPTPEWQIGEHHLYAPLSDFYELFEIPTEDDFEPEAWQSLLADAKNYQVADNSLLLVVLGESDQELISNASIAGQQIAAWDDPRTEARFPYVASQDSQPVTLKAILNNGLIFTRPDLIAALNALGVKSAPVSFYYFDKSRQKPFFKTPRALIQAAIGAGAPPGTFGGDGGFSTPVCASPPCTEP